MKIEIDQKEIDKYRMVMAEKVEDPEEIQWIFGMSNERVLQYILSDAKNWRKSIYKEN